jgi:hypothetical protein
MTDIKELISWTCNLDGETQHICSILVGKPLGKQPTGRLQKRAGTGDNTELELDLRKVTYEARGQNWLRWVSVLAVLNLQLQLKKLND